MVNRPPIYGDLEDGVGWLIIVLPTLSNSRIESIILSQLEKIQVSKTGSGKPLMDLGETHFWGPPPTMPSFATSSTSNPTPLVLPGIMGLIHIEPGFLGGSRVMTSRDPHWKMGNNYITLWKTNTQKKHMGWFFLGCFFIFFVLFIYIVCWFPVKWSILHHKSRRVFNSI